MACHRDYVPKTPNWLDPAWWGGVCVPLTPCRDRLIRGTRRVPWQRAKPCRLPAGSEQVLECAPPGSTRSLCGAFAMSFPGRCAFQDGRFVFFHVTPGTSKALRVPSRGSPITVKLQCTLEKIIDQS